MKIFKLIALLTLFSALYSCHNDDASISQIQNNLDTGLTTKKVTLSQVLAKVNNQKIREKVINENTKFTQNLTNINNSYNRMVIPDSIYTMIEYNDNTSFLLPLNSYSIENPYFLKLAINIDQNQQESFGILKYIPTSPTTSLDLKTFTGIMQVLDIDEEVRAMATFVNGIPTNNNQPNANARMICYDMVVVTAVNCGLRGNHAPGVACNDGVVRGHYSITTQTICNFVPSTPFLTQVIEDSNYDGLGAGGGINEILQDMLSPEELLWWNNATTEEKQPILDYLNPNVNDGDTWMFVKEAINAIKDGGEVDFENLTISDPEFKDSQLDCIHKKLKENPNGLYSKMLAEFNDNTGSTLTFKIGTTPAGDWGITKGSDILPNNYTITIAQNVENGSNLMKTVTLCHELIHAYMFNTLESANYIIFDSTGSPYFNPNISCNNSINYQNIDLNTLNTADRLVAILCAMNQVTPLTPQWSHNIFNTATFDIVTYRQALENFILANHDWDNESSVFKNRAMNTFGSNWKRKVAQATSWIGLEQTAGYQNYIDSHSSNTLQKLYLEVFKNIEILDAKSDCL